MSRFKPYINTLGNVASRVYGLAKTVQGARSLYNTAKSMGNKGASRVRLQRLQNRARLARAIRKWKPKSKNMEKTISTSNTVSNQTFRYSGSKRVNYKNKRLAQYSGALKHVLTRPHTIQYQTAGNLAQLGTFKQGKCQWYGFSMIQPSYIDNMLQNAGQTGSNVQELQEVFFEQASQKLQFKNNSDRGAQLTVYACFPRKDMSATQSLTPIGLNPSLLQDGFTNMVTTSLASSALAYDQYNASPFNSTNWCRMFKIKMVLNRYLEPGQMHVLNSSLKTRKIFDKARYGVKTADLISTDYAYLRDCGPIFLVRAQGTIAHDETTVTQPLSSGSATVTASSFNIEWLRIQDISIRCPYVSAQRQTGNFSSLLASAMTGSNEQAYVFSAFNESGDAA